MFPFVPLCVCSWLKQGQDVNCMDPFCYLQASEPIFNVVLAAMLFGEVRPFTVNVSLIPIAAGVAIASISEISYNVSHRYLLLVLCLIKSVLLFL